MGAARILLFIPMYNCAKQVPRVLAKVGPEAGAFFEQVLVVDNGSTDGSRETAAAALRAAPHLKGKVVKNRRNYSLGGSHKVAFNYALDNGFTHVVVLHGDDQADVRDLVPYLRSGAYDEADSFLGSRFMKGARLDGYSMGRRILNYGFNLVCSALSWTWITDQGSGLNMYKSEYLKDRFYLPFDNSLMFPNQMFFHGVRRPRGFAYFPISWREEDQKSNARVVEQAAKVFLLIFKGMLGIRPGENGFSRMEYAFDQVYPP
ncbi:MAG: glycosyltransferase family 2 protein [Elusimicrobia bacterium]|nr:glycosyltransferase family 2 protein [Elusimicrobiota bacterium]